MAVYQPTPAAAPAQPSAYQVSGRDKALLALIDSSKKTIYLRTERFDLIPVANALIQKIQDKKQPVLVWLDIPRYTGSDMRLVQILRDLGATVDLSPGSPAGYQGTYLLVDKGRFLYSAAPVDYTAPGTPRSYVEGGL